MNHTYAVIMAGGGGTRLWPISRREHPKHVLPLIGMRTLFQNTLDRLAGFISPEHIFIVTTAEQEQVLKSQVPELPAVNYLVEQNKFVEPLYEMEKNGQLTGAAGKGMDGRPFLEGQLVKAGQMLGNIWLTAWLEAPEDTYLERQLQQRASAGAEAK